MNDYVKYLEVYRPRPMWKRGAMEMIEYAAKLNHWHPDTLLRRDKTWAYSRPRFLVWWVMYHDMGYSYPRIAQIFGLKDHTGVLHGIRRVPELVRENDDYAVMLGKLRAFIEEREVA